MTQGPDFTQSGRALVELQLKLMRDATIAMAANTQRMQEDVDAILHAFAMMPVAADRIIRGAALGREREAAPARSLGAATARKPRRRGPSGEHAR